MEIINKFKIRNKNLNFPLILSMLGSILFVGFLLYAGQSKEYCVEKELQIYSKRYDTPSVISKIYSNSSIPMNKKIALLKTLAQEDIKCGDFDGYSCEEDKKAVMMVRMILNTCGISF
jgi:hypothetical protein